MVPLLLTAGFPDETPLDGGARRASPQPARPKNIAVRNAAEKRIMFISWKGLTPDRGKSDAVRGELNLFQNLHAARLILLLGDQLPGSQLVELREAYFD